MKTEKLFKTALTEKQQRNSELNHLEFTEGRTILKSYPRRIVFELTNKCNFSCIMCGREAINFKTSDLPVNVIKACEGFLPFIEETTLQGWGEGTLHPRHSEILEHLNGYPKLRKYFVSNGSTLPKIMDSIFEHHLDLLAVSLDGASPETNDSIRKGGNFTREVKSLKKLVNEKKKRGLDYPYINFVFTAMMRNIHELPAMVTLAHDIGIPEVKVVYLTIFHESLAHESLYGKQDLVKGIFAEAKELALKLNINLKLPEIQGEDNAGTLPHKPCAFPWRDMYIGSDGYIRPCQSSSTKLLKISDFGSFEEIWNSPQMQEFRSRVNDPETMPKSCRMCYQSTCANWNQKHSFLQLGHDFAPVWEKEAEPVLIAKQALETEAVIPQVNKTI